MYEQMDADSLHFTCHQHHELPTGSEKRLVIWGFSSIITFCWKFSRISPGGSFKPQTYPFTCLTSGTSRSEQDCSDLEVKRLPSQTCNPSQPAVPLLAVQGAEQLLSAPPAPALPVFPGARRRTNGPSTVCANHLLVTLV